jgi:transposase
MEWLPPPDGIAMCEGGDVCRTHATERESMKEASIIGLDLAKRSFQAQGALADGSVAFERSSRARESSAFCRAATLRRRHGDLRERTSLGRAIGDAGHEVRLIPPAYVKPFVKRQNNDAADAEAIAEAASRPTMRFVAVKTAEQQARAMLFRTRDLLVRQRTQLINALRGQLSEHGVVAPQGPASGQGNVARVRRSRNVGENDRSEPGEEMQ